MFGDPLALLAKMVLTYDALALVAPFSVSIQRPAGPPPLFPAMVQFVKVNATVCPEPPAYASTPPCKPAVLELIVQLVSVPVAFANSMAPPCSSARLLLNVVPRMFTV